MAFVSFSNEDQKTTQTPRRIWGRPKMTESDILQALSVYVDGKDYFAVKVKTGPSWTSNMLRIVDAIRIKKSWTNPVITIYEVKCTRQDFTRDDKWTEYLKYCHRFYFACPSQLIRPEEVEPYIGLVYVNDQGKAYTKRKSTRRLLDALPYDLFYYLIMNRLEEDRYPFHESKLEYWRDFVRYREDKHDIGRDVGRAFFKQLSDKGQKITELTRQLEAEGEITQILQEHDVTKYEMRQLIENRHRLLTPRLKYALERLVSEVLQEEFRFG